MKSTNEAKGESAATGLLTLVHRKLAETGRIGLTEKELCELLGICRLTAMRSRQSGKLKYCKLTATKLLYLPEHIEQFLKTCERQDTPRRARPRLSAN